MAPWLITFLIILINGFFVAAEFALVKVRASQIDVLIKQGNSKAILIKHIIDHLDNYLSACQLGITIASLALGWVGEPLIASQLVKLNHLLHLGLSETGAHALAIPITFFIITTLHIVIGEQAPKVFAIRDPLNSAFFIATPLHGFYVVLKPLIWFLNTLSTGFLRLFGITELSEDHGHSEEELRMIVAESEEDGHINASERELIQNVFDFDNRQVSEIMTATHKIFAVNKEDRSNDIIKEIVKEGYSRIPIYEHGMDNIIGRILLKDLTSHYIQHHTADINKLIRPIQYVPETMKIADCLRALQKSHLHIAVVTSEYGNTIGLVTMEDILEELVGDIHDEGDDSSHTIVTNPKPGVFIIDATASISEINNYLPIEIPEDENYDTMSGYINTLFGRIPSINEQITVDDNIYTIKKRKKQRVEQVMLELGNKEEIGEQE